VTCMGVHYHKLTFWSHSDHEMLTIGGGTRDVAWDVACIWCCVE